MQIDWLRNSPEHGELPHQPLLAVNVLAALLATQAQLHPLQRMDMLQQLDGYLKGCGINEKIVKAPIPVTYSTCGPRPAFIDARSITCLSLQSSVHV